LSTVNLVSFDSALTHELCNIHIGKLWLQRPCPMAKGGANKAGDHGQGGFDHIKVLVRIRPAQAAHGDRALAPSLAYGMFSGNCTAQDGGEMEPVVRVTKGQTCFEGEFDGVIPPGATQLRVFDEVRECIAHVVMGKNASIFAYGQTNSGKTYTMLGPPAAANALLDECAGGELKHAELGIVPRALAQLLAAKQEAAENGEAMSIECCYLQVYNERVLDLLANPDAISLSTTSSTGVAGAADTQRRRGAAVGERGERADAELKIRAGALGVEVVGAVKRRIETMAHVSSLLKEGSQHRKVRETKYNEASSRSHLILQVFLTRRTPQPAAEDTPGAPASAQMLLLSSTLSLVDLAGSERWDPQSVEGVLGKARTKEELRQLRASEGEKSVHRDEMAKINRSLTTLGRLVSMLSQGQDKGLPYRESKLTRLLQHSLGANSVTMMIATLSPEHEAADENICTLTFALSARQVKVHAHVNSIVEGHDAELARLRGYKLQIELLKRQLKEASASSSQASVLSDEMSVMQRKAQEQNLEIARLKGLLKASGPKKKGGSGHLGGVDEEHVKHLRGIRSKQSHL